jgi:hypothetical protein
MTEWRVGRRNRKYKMNKEKGRPWRIHEKHIACDS